MKSLYIVLVLAMLVGMVSWAQDAQPKAAWPAYFFSIVSGFGTGRYYLGQDGTPFLIGDLVGLGGIGAAFIRALAASSSGEGSLSAGFQALGLYLGGFIVYLVCRVWEFIDVFGAVDRAKEAGQVVEVVPVVDVRRTSLELEVSLKF